ncbi:uncharacterized protein [Dermacentor albipictus]|uniref:uncharacterized protein n=1 Tax=Dermacentor albipictus TaxID=60249 RepID=UPI0038FD1D57
MLPYEHGEASKQMKFYKKIALLQLKFAFMRTEVCLVLPLLFAPAFGGGGHSKAKDLPGYDGKLPHDPLASSPCAGYTVKRSCTGENSGYHYYRSYRFCLKNDNAHCGNYPNVFPSCEECSKKCNVSVCSEELTPPPMELPKISPFGR